MKKFIFIFISAIVFSACEGDQGPPGPQGPQGPYIIGTVFEIDNVNFNPGNDYSFLGVFYDYIPTNIEIFPSDVVLIYLYEGTENGNDIWSLMPQTFYLDGGAIAEYNYNHTVNDFQIFLSGNVNLNTLPPSFTQNQIFRIAILPAEFAKDPNVDIHNLESVIDGLEARDSGFQVIDDEFWRF
jgi:hypothetical protein